MRKGRRPRCARSSPKRSTFRTSRRASRVARQSERRNSWPYEARFGPLLPWPRFLRRAAMHMLIAFWGVVIADAIGTLGYHITAKLPWVDAFLNASMILGGMGPVDRLDTTTAKIFA